MGEESEDYFSSSTRANTERSEIFAQSLRKLFALWLWPIRCEQLEGEVRYLRPRNPGTGVFVNSVIHD